jgi:uncharacterized membrane protein
MNLEIIGITLDVLGKILLGLTVLLVHHKILKERRIDQYVIKEIKLEWTLGILGISLMIIGYIFELLAKI